MLAFSLSDGEIERFRKETEEILGKVGLRVCHPELRRLARNAGAKVDDAEEKVRIPPALLRELLASVPSRYTISGVDGTEHGIGGDAQWCQAIVTDPWTVDYQTQELRRPRLEDLRRNTIVGQKLDSVVAMSRMDFPVSDVPEPISSLRALEEHLLQNGKHIFIYATSVESFEQWLKIIDILSRGDPSIKRKLATVAVAVVSPLNVSALNCELLLRACSLGFPIIPTISTMAGTTGPYTKAGMLLQGNAEAIGMAALTQLIRRGNPYLYTWLGSVADLRSGEDLYYTIDKILWKGTNAQLARSYGIPVSIECGGAMSYAYDQQNGAESVLFMLSAHQSKANMLAGIGSSYNGITMSAEMMVVQNCWLELARHLARGVDTDELHMGLESIRRAGPGGNYLMDDLTLRFARSSEFFQNDLFDYSVRAGERRSMLLRAHEKVEELIAGFSSPLPAATQGELKRFFEEEYRAMA